MPRLIVPVISLTFALTACAGRPVKTIGNDAQTHTRLTTAYSCVVSAVENAGYVVTKDESRLAVRGQLRDEAGPESPQQRGGKIGGEGSRQDDLNAVPMPYSIDGVGASVVVDPTSGAIRVHASAYTGSGSTSRSGYVQLPPSDRGQKAVRMVNACADQPA
jgi:hypothetical protein